jgi:diguanylate cyclase (GGDEF)-like protein/PAS domain S-box-containing protein
MVKILRNKRIQLLRKEIALAIGVALLYWMAAMCSLVIRHTAATIWLANGLLLGILLAAPKRRWPGYLLAGFFAGAIAGIVTADRANDGKMIAPFVLCIPQMIEVLVAASLLRRILHKSPDLTRKRDLAWFAVIGVVLGPATSGLLAVIGFYFVYSIFLPKLFLYWFLGNALGIATQTPLILGLRRVELARIFSRRRLLETISTLLLVLIATVAIFAQNSYPILFIVFPLLLIVSFRLGLAGSAICVQLVMLVAIVYTYAGHGPTMLLPHGTAQSRAVVLQIFFFLAVAQLYPVAAIIEERRRLESNLRRSESLYRLLAEESADVITLVDRTGVCTYASPAVRDVLGWDPADLVGQPASVIVHPDDLQQGEETLHLFLSGLDHRFNIVRLLRKDGSYVWIEANIRAMRDPQSGELLELISTMRDVSTRVEREMQLEEAKNRAETLAANDALTDLPNRRAFDEGLANAWREAQQQNTPLSVLMIDIDFFKGYNDSYGHQAGDEALRRVAAAIRQSVRVPNDLPARYGGEEFGVILINANEDLALSIAQRILSQLHQLQIPHTRSPLGYISVSLGVATVLDIGNDTAEDLVAAADRALYAAKREGRNRIIASTTLSQAEVTVL